MELEKLKIPYSCDFNLGMVLLYFSGELESGEVIKLISRMNGRIGKFGIGLKRKSRLENLQKKIVKRVKMRHDPFLKMNPGKLIDITDELIEKIPNEIKAEPTKIISSKDSEANFDSFIKKMEIDEDNELQGKVSINDNLDGGDKVDKALIDKILFNKDSEEKGEDNNEHH